MEQDKQFLTFLVCLVLVVSSLSAAIVVSAGGEEGQIMLVRDRDGKAIYSLQERGVNVLDQYNNYILVKCTSSEKDILEEKGIEVKSLPARTQLSVKGYKFDIEQGQPDFADELKIDSYEKGTNGMYIVHMLGPVNPEWRQTLQQKGVEIMTYVPNYAYQVRMTPSMKEEVKALDFVDWVSHYHPGYKMSQQLETGPIEVVVHKSSTTDESLKELAGHFDDQTMIRRTGSGDFRLIGEVSDIQTVEEMANVLDVIWIDNYSPPTLHDEIGIQIAGGYFDKNNPGDSPYRGPGDHGSHANQLGYDGSNVMIQVADTGLGDGTTPDAGHSDFTNRVAGGTDMGSTVDGWNDGHGHGTHCSGLAAGDTYGGNGVTYAGWTNFYTGQGSADGAELWATQIFEDDGSSDMPSTDYEIPEDGKQNGAYVSSNSWGESRGDSTYEPSDSDYDRAVRDADSSSSGDQPMSIVVAAGNNGDGSSTLGSPANAKNVISVGSSRNYMPDSTNYGNSGSDVTNIDYVSDFSSRGPESDGRIKPDVTAPGETTLSTSTPANVDNLYGLYSEDSRYEWCSGTSQACPTVAGASAVVADYYESTYGSLPSPAMIKALIINAAQDMDDADGNTDAIPNYDEGWGRTFLPPIVDQNKYPDWMVYDRPSQMQTGDIDSYNIEVQDTSKPLNVSMVYTDNEAVEGDNPTLKNDLHLRVTDPSGNVWYGNAFSGGMSVSGSGNINGDWDTDGDDNDDRNNLENVFISTADLESGTYTVEVEALDVPEDGIPETAATDQDYALAMYNAQTPSGNTAPDAPTNPDPADGETGVMTDTTLSVDVSDPDGDKMDVSFYNASDDSLIGTENNVQSGNKASVGWSNLAYDYDYSWYAVADDGTDTTRSNTWIFHTVLPSMDISLYSGGNREGWNFVSYKLINQTEVEGLLNDTDYGIRGSYDKVMYYDASGNGWQTFTPDRGSHYNSIGTWNNEMGIWIHMTADDTLTINGSRPSSTTITLQPGWNMVGYPSNADRTASNTLPAAVTKMAVFDSSQEYNLNYVSDLTTVTMTAGNGYWVYNGDSASVDWTVNYT